MSPPGPTWSLRGRANFRSEAAADVDPLRARREWLALAEAIESLGGKVAVLPPDETLTGLPYAAEAGAPLLAAGERQFLLSRMKPAHRRGEAARWRPLLEALGFDVVELERGIWEGQGDVATFAHHTFLFYGGRTDEEGLAAARSRFVGHDVVELRIFEPAFHGNMALLPLEHVDRLLVGADVLHDDALALLEAKVGRDRMCFISEEEVKLYATNGLPIGDTLIAPSIVPERVRKLVEKLGMKILELAMPELCEKAGGASRCLVCRIPGQGTVTVPEAYSLDRAREVIGAR